MGIKKLFRQITGEEQRDTASHAGGQARASLQEGYDAANAFLSLYADRSPENFQRLMNGIGPNGEFSQSYQGGFDPNAFAFGPDRTPYGYGAPSGYGQGPGSGGRYAQRQPNTGIPRPFSSNRFDFKTDPGYQFRLAQGSAAIDRGAASRGKALSGQAARELAQFGQNLASEEFNRARNRALEENKLAYGRALGENELAYGRALQQDIRGENRFNQTDERRYNRIANLVNSQLQTANRQADMRNNLGGNLANNFMGTAAALNQASNAGMGRLIKIAELSVKAAKSGATGGADGAASP
jgi:hypothetical protein